MSLDVVLSGGEDFFFKDWTPFFGDKSRFLDGEPFFFGVEHF